MYDQYPQYQAYSDTCRVCCFYWNYAMETNLALQIQISQMSKGVTFIGLPLTMVLLVRLLLIMSTSLTLRVRVGRALRESDKLHFDR